MRKLLVLALILAGAALVITSGPLYSSEADRAIEDAAKDLYVIKTYLKGDNITIQANDGVVTLTGTVANDPHRVLAQEAVANLLGVTRVDNQLAIPGDPPVENSDAWIAAKVKTALLFHRNVSGMGTEVSVNDGKVILRGEAASLAEKQLTTEYAKDVDGVKDVENEMTVAKEPKAPETIGEKIDDASITAQVKMALVFHRSTSVFKTQVKTVDGVVTIGGTAKNDAEKALVTKLVSDIRGVVSVNNNMTFTLDK